MKQIRVLFVCHGNICRSTMAQYVLQDKVNKKGLSHLFVIDSAATSQEEIGNDVHPGTRQVLNEQGIPCGHHTARQLRSKDATQWDYFIGMDSANIRNMKRILGRDSHNKIYKLLEFSSSEKDVADPWYTGDFDTTFDDINSGCNGFLNYLGL